MLKNIKLKNSTIILTGIVLIFVGFVFGFIEFFQENKENTFSDRNILLYESETPEEIKSDEEIKKKQKKQEKEVEEQPTETQKEQTTNNSGNTGFRYNYIGFIEIPKIGVKRGFLDVNERYNNVDYNVTVIQGSNYPDVEAGNLILAAHSGNCSYCYFDKLYKLSKGDEAYVTYGDVKYAYKIVDIYEVEKTGTVAIYRDYSKKVLTLITCTRNSKTKQTVYILENY